MLLIGLLGMACILSAFLLEEFTRRFGRSNLWFNVLNFVGAVLLGLYAFSLRGWPFVVLNGVWAIAAFIRSFTLLSSMKK